MNNTKREIQIEKFRTKVVFIDTQYFIFVFNEKWLKFFSVVQVFFISHGNRLESIEGNEIVSQMKRIINVLVTPTAGSKFIETPFFGGFEIPLLHRPIRTRPEHNFMDPRRSRQQMKKLISKNERLVWR